MALQPYFLPDFQRHEILHYIEILEKHMAEPRKARLKGVLPFRSRKCIGVFEHTYHSHNIGAVLRSMEAFGFQDVFFVYHEDEPLGKLKDKVDRGTSMWLTVRRAPTLEDCARYLSDIGYKIFLVSRPDFYHTGPAFRKELKQFAHTEFLSPSFKNFVEDAPVAFLFGSEMEGLSEKWLPYADAYVHVPLLGLVESLNVSVCAGIILSSFRSYVEKTLKIGFEEEEKEILWASWLSYQVKGAFSHSQNHGLEKLYESLLEGHYFRPWN